MFHRTPPDGQHTGWIRAYRSQRQPAPAGGWRDYTGRDRTGL